jgi:hypothetical protein
MIRLPLSVSRLLLVVAALLVLHAPTIGVSLSAETDKDQQPEEVQETARLITAELPRWKLWKGADHARELKLEPKAILRWTNPTVGRLYGDVYVWTADGRPEVVMSLYKAWEPAWGFAAEMHSLSLTEISAERDGRSMWQPSKAGINLKDVADASEPAELPVRRLQQMRAIANNFSATMTDERLTASGERQELRLLTQPVYRYQCTDSEIIDGALFAIVLGTDPEVFLLLEARQTQGAARWQYALARMNNDGLRASYKGSEIWKVERGAYPGKINDPYRVMSVTETR